MYPAQPRCAGQHILIELKMMSDQGIGFGRMDPRDFIITPHIGGMSDIYLEQAYPIVRANLGSFLADTPGTMINVVPH